MSASCECKMQNLVWRIKNKCKVCKRTVCDTCSVDWQMSSPRLCRTCDLVGRIKFEHKELMLLTDEQLIDIVSFFGITLKSSTIIKVDMVNLILNVCRRHPKKLQNLMTVRRIKEHSPIELSTETYQNNEEKQDQIFYEDNNNQGDFEEKVPQMNVDQNTCPEELTVDMIPFLNMHQLQQQLQRLNIDCQHCLERQDYIDALTNHLMSPNHQLREKSTTSSLRSIRASSSDASAQTKGSNLQGTSSKFLSLQDISSIDMIPSLSIKQLQYILQRRSVDCQNLSEKSQLAYRVSQFYHQMYEPKPSDLRKLKRKTSKRDAFYLENATTTSESEECVHQNLQTSPVRGGNVITQLLQQIKSADDIENLSCEQLKSILTQNSIPCNDVAHQKWELAFKVLQLWYNDQATREADLKCCVICMDNEIDCTMLECGHTIACTKCASNLDKCPMCCKPVLRLVKIFKP